MEQVKNQYPAGKNTRKCMYFGLGSLLALALFIFAPMLWEALNFGRVGAFINLFVMLTAIALGVTSIVFGIRALKNGERSYMIWLGLVPAFIAVALPLTLLVAEVAEMIRSAITGEPMRY